MRVGVHVHVHICFKTYMCGVEMVFEGNLTFFEVNLLVPKPCSPKLVLPFWTKWLTPKKWCFHF